MKDTPHKARFERYRDDSLIAKCERYAHWTLPYLMADPDLNPTGRQIPVERDYQEMGALLTNNLATKLAALLFPVNVPFFEATPSKKLIEDAKQRGIDETTLRSELANLTTAACKRVFHNGGYAQLVSAVRHLIVTGNVLLRRVPEDQTYIAYGLQHYAVRRDGMGRVMDTILRERADFETLPPDVQKELRRVNPGKYRRAKPDCVVELYTRIHRKYGKTGKAYWEVSQQADNIDVGTPGTYPEHLCPYMVLTWNHTVGEHYGRGLVEDYAGGFAKLSDGSEAAMLYGIEILRVLHLVEPGLGADIDEMATAESGEWVQGSNGSVSAYEAGDFQKLQAIRAELQEVVQNLARAFMWRGNTRDAERVTAYEIRQDAQEADNSLGGVYSTLAQVWQVPTAHQLIHEERPELLPGLLTSNVKLNVVTGVPALGRNADIQTLLSATQEAAAIVPALAQLDDRIDSHKVFDLVMSRSNLDIQSLFLDEEALAAKRAAQEQQAQGMQQMLGAEAGIDAAQGLQTLS